MAEPKPEPCPCCGAEMETFRRRAATASRPEGWRVLRPRTRGCSICRYLAEGSFDVSVRLIEDWNRRAIASALYDALKVALAALERDNWESDQSAIETARAAVAVFEGKEVTKPKRPPIPADLAAQLDRDAEIYGNAFAHLSKGSWKRLDPTEVSIKAEGGKS